MIATVLLISIVIILGLIVFMWFKSISQEAIIKFSKNIELVCDDVSFDASYSGGMLYLSNTGAVPIYNIKLKLIKAGSHETKDLAGSGLNQGGVLSKDISDDTEGVEKIKVIPVLIGKSDSGDRSFVCDERNGVGVEI